VDEEVSPLKRSGSARPRIDLSKSAPASRTAHHFIAKEENEDDMSEVDERAQSPSPSKQARVRTPLKQSRIPVPKNVNRPSTDVVKRQPTSQSGIPVSTQKPPHSVRRANAIAQNAEIFANQRGIGQGKIGSGMPASTPMSKVRSTPSNAQAHQIMNGAQSPSAPRYAQATAASMSKSMSQPLPGSEQMMRSTASHSQHQYAAYAHIQHPLPLSPTQTGNASSAFEQMMNSTPSKQQKLVFPDLSPPEPSMTEGNMRCRDYGSQASTQSARRATGNRPVHQRSQTSQPALHSGPDSSPSRIPSAGRSKPSPGQSKQASNASSLAIPDGFVIGGKLYPAENVEEAMKAYKASTASTPSQGSITRMASNHSTSSNGPVQELTMPAPPFYGQQQNQLQYLSQTNQNYVIGIAPDGQQIPLITQQPQNATSYSPWQNVPAFMPSSTQATPSTGFAYDFNQSLEPLQNYDFNTLYTPNTANSNMSNMPNSGGLWYPQQNSANQGADFSQYLISSDSFNNGTSPTFFVNDANGRQQEYVLAGPSVEVTDATGFAPTQQPIQWTTA